MKIFDFFAINITLYSDKSKTYNTKFGAVISMLVSVIIILLIIAFGQDFYNRTNPLIIRETEITEDYLVYQINNKNFSIAVRLENDSGNKLIDIGVLKLTAYYKWLDLINGTWVPKIQRLNLVNCTKDMFYGEEVFAKMGLENFLCPQLDNIKFGGSWSSDKVGYIVFQTRVCSKGLKIYHDDGEIEHCTTDIEYDDIPYGFKSFFPYMSTIYQQALVTPSNYTTGIQYALKNQYFLLDKLMAVADYYYFQPSKMVTDYGWILKSVDESTILGSNSKTTSFLVTSYNDVWAGTVGIMYFYLDKNIDRYYREYMKIQVLAANVGGIIKVFIVAAQLFVTFYNQTDYIFELTKNLCNSSDSNKIAHTRSFIVPVKLEEKEKINNYVKMNDDSMELSKNKVNVNNLKQYDNTNKLNLSPIKLKEDNINVNRSFQEQEKNFQSFDIKLAELPQESSINSNNVKEFLKDYNSPIKFFLYKFSCNANHKLKYKRFASILNQTISLLEINTFIKAKDEYRNYF